MPKPLLELRLIAQIRLVGSDQPFETPIETSEIRMSTGSRAGLYRMLGSPETFNNFKDEVQNLLDTDEVTAKLDKALNPPPPEKPKQAKEAKK